MTDTGIKKSSTVWFTSEMAPRAQELHQASHMAHGDWQGPQMPKQTRSSVARNSAALQHGMPA